MIKSSDSWRRLVATGWASESWRATCLMRRTLFSKPLISKRCIALCRRSCSAIPAPAIPSSRTWGSAASTVWTPVRPARSSSCWCSARKRSPRKRPSPLSTSRSPSSERQFPFFSHAPFLSKSLFLLSLFPFSLFVHQKNASMAFALEWTQINDIL